MMDFDDNKILLKISLLNKLLLTFNYSWREKIEMINSLERGKERSDTVSHRFEYIIIGIMWQQSKKLCLIKCENMSQIIMKYSCA